MAELHAHIESYAVDCDGPISRHYVMTMNDAERAEAAAANGVNDFSDIHFHDRVVAAVVNTYSIFVQGRLEVTRHVDGSVRLVWSEPTEEGGRTVEATICTEECDTGESGQRDHYAEAMGY